MFKLIKLVGSIVIWTLIVVVMLAMCNRKTTEETVDTPTDWVTVFSGSGFTDEEIANYSEILNNIGITDSHDVEVIENGRMHIAKGKIFDSDECFLHVTLEERKIIYICVSVPYDITKVHNKWKGDIDLDSEYSNDTFDLYYDVDGGYVAKLDWENKTIRPYHE